MKAMPEVPRWTEPRARAPHQLRDALGALRDDGPSEAQLERMIAGVSSALGMPAESPAVASFATPIKLGVALLALAGAAWLGFQSEPERRATQAPAVSPAPETRLATPSAPEPEPDPALGPAPESAAPAAARAIARPKLRQPPKQTTAAAEPQDITGEIALLRRARRAVESAPRDALALLAQHRTIPHPAFAEERDAIEIEALLATGERERALHAYRTFRALYPHSAYSRRLERVLAGEP